MKNVKNMKNMTMGFKGRLFKDEGGVSEILGDILLVSVVVVVIGALASQLLQIDEPQGGITTDLSARLDGNDLLITHMGGAGLRSDETKIYVGVANSITKQLKIEDGLSGNTWKIGETWSQDINSEVTIATTNNFKLFVQVIDTSKDMVILDQILLGGIEDKSFPDVGFETDSMGFSKTVPDGGEAINISVKVVNKGFVTVKDIEVRFFDDKDLIGVNTSITTLAPNGQANDNATVKLNWTTTSLGRHIISAKIIPKINETNLANNYISKKLTVGFGINLDFIKPNLIVKSYSISKSNPKSKETVVLNAKIANTAKITATGFTLRWGELFEGTNSTLNSTVYVGNVTYVKDVVLRYEWTPSKGGQHTIWINIENVLPSGEDPKADADPDLDGDYAELDVNVLPKILLVDDDLAVKGTPKDTGVYMREALKAIGVSPDIISVGSGDGPQYTGTGITLDDYDLVVWMTGYEKTNTLTTGGATSDISNLKSYLDAGGSLWMIGQDVTNDLWNNGGVPGRNFLKNYLHVNGQTLDVQLTSTVRGNDNNVITAGLDFDTSVPSGQTATPDIIQPLSSSSAMDNATNGNMSLLYNQSGYKVANFAFEFSHIKGLSDRSILAYRILTWFNATVFFEGDDLSISEVTIDPQNPYFKQEVTITATIRNNGINDLNNVKVIFKELYLGVETVIATDPRDTAGGMPAADNPMSLNISALGSINITVKHWVPNRIGLHQIKVIVDPNDVISELDESNNEFVSELSSTLVFVDSITMIVDDDHTVSGAENTTKTIVDAMEFLGYRYELYNVSLVSDDGPTLNNLTRFNSVIWVLGNESQDGTTLTTADSANIDTYLTGYQGDVWIIGQNFIEDDTLRSNTTFTHDILGINAFTRDVSTPATLEGIKNNDITHGMRYSTTPTFADEADAITPGTGVDAIFQNGTGSVFSTAFHNTSGVDYKVTVSTFEFSFIDDVEDQREFIYMLYQWMTQSDNRIELRVTWEDLTFGRDDGPPQAFDQIHPVLGNSYIIQAKIWNAGNNPAGAIVRFLDGDTVINSASIYIPASTKDSTGTLQLGSEFAEIIWTPLFAGQRSINVKVDPDSNIPISNDPRSTTGEVFKKNNNLTRGIEVFFFYDDMENGKNNWDHDATILNINGEQPIEYFDRLRPVDTNLIDDFDWANSKDWQKFLTDGHSLPSSFKMSEPLNQNLSTGMKLKIAMCIDDSGSMSSNDPTFLRLDAAYNFMNSSMRDGDQLTVYRFGTIIRNLYQFQYGASFQYEDYPFENMSYYLTTAPNASAFNNGHGMTSLYACIQLAISQINAWGVPNQLPIIIAITDGNSNRGITFRNFHPIVRASGVPIYTIGLGAGVRTRELYDVSEASNGGKYYFASSAAVLNDTFGRIADDIGSGASRSIDNAHDGSASRESDGASGTSNGPSSRVVRNIFMLNPVGGELWGKSVNRNITWACRATTQANCANARIQISVDGGGWTTIANNAGTRLDFPAYHQRIWYRNADSRWYPRQAGGSWIEVFNANWTIPDIESNNVRIRVCITDGGQVCRGTNAFEVFDMGVTFGGGGMGETVKTLTTEEFQLTNYEKATLNFWQRYDLLYTENGGFIEIGTAAAAAGPYLYKYAEPTQPYSGNLRLDKTVTDDYGTEIQWAWNGRSGGGTFAWEHAKVDLTPFIDAARPWVKIQFKFFTWGFGNGGSWWLDDVRVTVKRSDTTVITNAIYDQWEFFEWNSGVDPVALQPHSGTHMWWNHNPAANNDTKGGIDNSLYSKSIDLTNAKDAYVSAYFKFNYDDDAGRPPDGFRTEVSNDNGVTWRPINLGVRSSWGISGDWSTDGKSPSGNQAYTGIQDNGADSNVPVWVEAGSLWRLNTNISGWAGNIIKLRFRVVTNLDATHYETASTFRGFAVDDVIIRGNTTISGAPIPQIDNCHIDIDGGNDVNNHHPLKKGPEHTSVNTELRVPTEDD